MAKLVRNPLAFVNSAVNFASFCIGQLKLCRWLLGGVWVKLRGGWKQVGVAGVLSDGTFILRDRGGNGSFHETHVSIRDIEKYL